MSSRGTFHYLTDIYHQASVSSSLKDAVVSIGTAGLANFYKDPNVMVNANRKYSSALSSVSSLLHDLPSAKDDQTLIAVVLLGLYETYTCSGAKSIESWVKHISGAEALLQLRGKEQLETDVGRDLFVQIRAQVITKCWQTYTAVPNHIVEWSEVLRPYENVEEHAATRLSQISIRFCNLRMISTNIHESCGSSKFSQSKNIIARALEIDNDLANWAATCPSEYQYRIVNLEKKSDEVYSDYYHVYDSIWAATIWNDYRVIRILINELLVHHLRISLQELASTATENPSSFLSGLIQNSTSISVQLTHDICSSVPFCLNFSPESSQTPNERHPPKTISGNHLLWPLYVAARTPFVAEMMRKWAGSRLRMVADDMGIKQATVLADYAADKKDGVSWENDCVGPQIDTISSLAEILGSAVLDL